MTPEEVSEENKKIQQADRVHLVFDNEYNEVWCNTKGAAFERTTYEIDETTCIGCLNRLHVAGHRAFDRMMKLSPVLQLAVN